MSVLPDSPLASPEAATDVTADRAPRPGGVLMLGPLPPPPRMGGIANGILLLRDTDLTRRTGMGFFNTYNRPDPTRRLATRVRYQLGMYARFVTTVRRTRPALVHVKTAAWVNFYQNAGYTVLARLLRCATVLQIHDGTFPAFVAAATPRRARWIRRLLRAPDAVIALSDHWAAYFRDTLGARTVRVVPNGLLTARYRDASPDRARLGIPAGRRTVLFVGTATVALDREKGLEELVAAVAAMRATRPDVILLLAGGAAHDDWLPAHLGPAGDGWLRIGAIDDARKATLYRSVDVFALPSRAENMPNTLLEAMAAGCAIVASPVGAVPEMLADEQEGLHAAVGDVAALTQALARLCDDPALRSRLGARAMAAAAARYDLHEVERSLVAVYESLVAGISGPR